jgi:hypothetical protein
MKPNLLRLFFFAFLSACSSTPKTPVQEAPLGFLIQARESVARDSSLLFPDHFAVSREIRVRFATNRDQESSRPGSSLVFGETRVKVPDDHPVGSIADRYERGPTKSLSLQELKASVSEAPNWGVLVFIHGFNVEFQEALFRSAQIAFDLKFQGTVLLLSWPAGKGESFLEKNLINKTYAGNRQNALKSIEVFSTLFQELSQWSIPIQTLVHSMGHQVALPALLKITGVRESGFIQELVLNAPDFDPDEFGAAIPALKRLAKRITLYCSEKDNAMIASKAFNGRKRLGACVRHEGVDVVNVSEVDDPGLTGLGHGYYSSRPVLTDLAQVFLGVPAENRLFIRKSGSTAPEHYFLRR